jgi:polar amino acid transport system substrate-binding protein
MPPRLVKRCCLLLFLLLMTVPMIRAGAAPASPAQPAIVLAFSELAPWKTKEGGSFGGAYTEIVRELARRLGRELLIVECPHKRCLRLLELGEADVSIGLQHSPEREAYLQFMQTHYRRQSSDRVFYVRGGEAARIARYEDLYGLRIATKAGSEYFDRFDADGRIDKDTGPNNTVNLRKLLMQRVDAVVMPEDQAAALSGQLGLDRQVEPAQFRVTDPTPRSLAISRRSGLLAQLPQLERALQAMRENGSLASIYDRHYYKAFGVTRQQIRLE